MTRWWRASVILSRALCGPRGKPLCARIHEARPSAWRTAAMVALDIAFAEPDHCARIHRRWKALQPTRTT
ncbi:hypothetical protein OC539_19275 [Paracoccus denitrificans]|uniref:hypothetical protein n=1 Tax=Paracoccus denitrificans TaxID=266 RepID=UPI00032384FD|nr:hypothetical protein [Paracoccus denitrificans]MBB4629383.1 hypothetical protein [Paracoccus denitrificans]MCU7430472.1 hypothetical protein [Paracoccus denitrificans]QAR28258.1 hypothetical protein EO213_18265 [Paracoccus denitrificans]UPV97998.1 hypothetical protein M0K93_18350 [Paracoccus denitrificans]WQO35915.1 hypothetical protein U0005_15635 [Paracoccus denitrificans]